MKMLTPLAPGLKVLSTIAMLGGFGTALVGCSGGAYVPTPVNTTSGLNGGVPINGYPTGYNNGLYNPALATAQLQAAQLARGNTLVAYPPAVPLVFIPRSNCAEQARLERSVRDNLSDAFAHRNDPSVTHYSPSSSGGGTTVTHYQQPNGTSPVVINTVTSGSSTRTAPLTSYDTGGAPNSVNFIVKGENAHRMYLDLDDVGKDQPTDDNSSGGITRTGKYFYCSKNTISGEEKYICVISVSLTDGNTIPTKGYQAIVKHKSGIRKAFNNAVRKNTYITEIAPSTAHEQNGSTAVIRFYDDQWPNGYLSVDRSKKLSDLYLNTDSIEAVLNQTTVDPKQLYEIINNKYKNQNKGEVTIAGDSVYAAYVSSNDITCYQEVDQDDSNYVSSRNYFNGKIICHFTFLPDGSDKLTVQTNSPLPPINNSSNQKPPITPTGNETQSLFDQYTQRPNIMDTKYYNKPKDDVDAEVKIFNDAKTKMDQIPNYSDAELLDLQNMLSAHG